MTNVAGPWVRNTLPASLRLVDDEAGFRRPLKAHLLWIEDADRTDVFSRFRAPSMHHYSARLTMLQCAIAERRSVCLSVSHTCDPPVNSLRHQTILNTTR